jgi:ABC-type branched-subunit amino acid transport system substrate-binding protein
MRIGLLVPRSGASGLWAPSAEACALLAAAELNAAGGIAGRAVELFIRDTGVDVTTAADAAADLAEIDEVDVVAGMHPSCLRSAIGNSLRGRSPYLFTPHYEGGEYRPGICAIGETAPEMLSGSIAWLISERRARRFFFASTNCVWPQGAMAAARRVVPSAGAVIVGDVVVKVGGYDFEPVIDKIRRAAPDVVVICMTGMEGVVFNRHFADAGLQQHHLRLALGFDETALYALGEAASENLYVPSGYFAGLQSRANGAFLERYHTAFDGAAPPPNGFAQSCYEGLHLLAAMMLRDGTLRRLGPGSATTLAFRTARGNDPISASRRRPLHLGLAQGTEFRLVAHFSAY